MSFVLAQAVITNYYRLGGLHNRNVFLTVLEARKSKIKVPTDFIPGEGSFLCLQTVIFSLCHHMVEAESSGVPSSSYKSTSPIRLEFYPMTSFNLYHSSQGLSLNTVTLGVEPSTCEFLEEHQYPIHNTIKKEEKIFLLGWVYQKLSEEAFKIGFK